MMFDIPYLCQLARARWPKFTFEPERLKVSQGFLAGYMAGKAIGKLGLIGFPDQMNPFINNFNLEFLKNPFIPIVTTFVDIPACVPGSTPQLCEWLMAKYPDVIVRVFKKSYNKYKSRRSRGNGAAA